MPRYKLILILIIIFLSGFLFSRSEFVSIIIGRYEHQTGQETDLPRWLSYEHRMSGPYAFDFIPLNLDDPKEPVGDKGTGDTAPPAGGITVYPGGSPYPPGTLADMIWQQKQRDQRYGN